MSETPQHQPLSHLRPRLPTMKNSAGVVVASSILAYPSIVRPLLPLLLLLPLETIVPRAHAQSNAAAGCDASCPPVGYESFTHLCPGEAVESIYSSKSHDVCHPPSTTSSSSSNNNSNTLVLDSFRRPGYVTVLANYYTGCEAGRRESGVFAGLAQRHHDASGGSINFVVSLKGGGDCATWAGIYTEDAVAMGLTTPANMPLTISDGNNDFRDAFFTPPYPHPAVNVVLDENLEVTFKGVGPCCGYEDYYACTDDVALALDDMLSEKIDDVYARQMSNLGVDDGGGTADAAPEDEDESTTVFFCNSTEFSEWSPCSMTCGDGGIRFRHRAGVDAPVETQPCPSDVAATLPACPEQQPQCVVPEFGASMSASVVAGGFDSPRDLAFHPSPGVHLGPYSEGRAFHPDEGEELWVANGNNHSVSIIASLGTAHQTTMPRADRGRYHYMNNVTALAFNSVGGSLRRADQDTFNYVAVCNDNLNNYVGTKEPNYFMGPTFYDTDTVNKVGKLNTVNRMGEDCGDRPYDQCFFLHADMLHEAPACLGIAHDPEEETSYGSVFWAFDSVGDNGGDGGQLVRFDFSQPHGPGSMDHSIANVRRYPEVKLYRDATTAQGHAGMVVHPTKRMLYVANPGKGTVVAVHVDTGRYSRTAREEYPIFSNKLPSFEYSIYECVDQEEAFASGLDNPSGLALSSDGERLFVAERSGRILALDAESGMVMQSIDLAGSGYTSIGGLAVSPATGALYFADMNSNSVVRIDPDIGDEVGQCASQLPIDPNYQSALSNGRSIVDSECGQGTFSLVRDYSCTVDGTIPNGTLFEQVHPSTGYASDDPNVQSPMAGMDEAAALLLNRTDCEYDSELNFDQLLLGGYFCHICLPYANGSACDAGGNCANVQWNGFTCDNEYFVDFDAGLSSLLVSSLHYNKTYPTVGGRLEMNRGVTYRFTVRAGPDRPVSIVANVPSPVASSVKSLATVGGGTTNGPILLVVDDSTPDCLYLTSPGLEPMMMCVGGATDCPIVSSDDISVGLDILSPKTSDGFLSSPGVFSALFSFALFWTFA